MPDVLRDFSAKLGKQAGKFKQNPPTQISILRGIAGVIMMQFLPFADTKALEIYDIFERGVYQLADASLKPGP